jgi:uncharacterized metal-binding protein
MRCADCEDKACYGGEDCPGLREDTLAAYDDDSTRRMTQAATRLEGDWYMKLTRLQELIRFSEAMGYRRLGVAFCIGFSEEAKLLCGLLEKRFELESVCCKVCGIEKEKLGLVKIAPERTEAMCNPAGQAMVLNQARTHLNVILGLCIGHDITFTQQSEAPVTTLVVKDRVLAHNPVGALYSRYWRNRIARELGGGPGD